MKKNGITEYYEEVETTGEYEGYFCSVSEAITIAILGSICGLKNVSQIHQWATNEQSKRIFDGEIRNQSCALLFLASIPDENGKTGIAQSKLCELGVFVHARKSGSADHLA